MSPAVRLAWAIRRFGFERVGGGRESWGAFGHRRHFYRRGRWTVSIIAGRGPYHVAWGEEGHPGHWYVITSSKVPVRVVLALVGEIV